MAMSECQCEIKKLTKTIQETKSPKVNNFAQGTSITQFLTTIFICNECWYWLKVYLSEEDPRLGAIHNLFLSFNRGDRSWGSYQFWQVVPIRSSGSSNYLQVHVFDMQSRENSFAQFNRTRTLKFDFSFCIREILDLQWNRKLKRCSIIDSRANKTILTWLVSQKDN